MAADRMITICGMKTAGFARTAAAVLRTVLRIPSAIIALATPAMGSRGPWPTRALLRSRRRASRRCITVSPGKR
jgi:hypothetical protein